MMYSNYPFKIIAVLIAFLIHSDPAQAQWDWNTSAPDMYNTNAGNVMIGSVTNHTLISNTGNLQLMGNANFLVGPNEYAFKYSGGNHGLFFNASDAKYEFLDGSGNAVFTIEGTGGNLFTAGNIEFAPGKALHVGGNEYAFQYSANPNFGLYFNQTDTRYEFRDGSASPTAWFNANSGDARLTGSLQIGNSTTPAAGKIRWTGTDFQGNNGTTWLSLTAGNSSDNDWSGAGTGSMYVSDIADNVGIGTSTPLNRLHVYGTAQTDGIGVGGSSQTDVVMVSLHNNNSGGRSYRMQSSGGNATLGQGKFSILDGHVQQHRLVIDSTGNVGIGDTSPTCPLDVKQTSVGTVAAFTGSTDGLRTFRTFINEIVLLEKNPLISRDRTTMTVSRRSTRLHGPSSGDLFSQGVALSIMTACLATAMFGNFTFVKGVLANSWKVSPFMLLYAMPLACWLVAIYLNVVRFLRYLDLRIRHEGWEVELRMRAEANRMASKSF